MSDLLPPNATDQEHALADTGALRIEGIQVLVREMWNPQTCPPGLLPWLAWAFSVDDWDAAWTTQQKRDTIASAIAVQQIKGTIGSVRKALEALGIDARVQEWFNQTPVGEPYTYRLILQSFQTEVTDEGLQKVLDVVDSTKSLRSHLSEIDVYSRTEARSYVGAASNIGCEVTVKFRHQAVVLNESSVVLANDRPVGILANQNAIILR